METNVDFNIQKSNKMTTWLIILNNLDKINNQTEAGIAINKIH